MSVRVSVVIPTYNRSEYLRKAIQSLIDQTLPRDQFEIIVVDNGSTDRTKAVVSEEFGNFNLRYVKEPKVGLCWARNTGWLSANGDYVAYLDDDAIASRRWLEAILDVFDGVKPVPGCVGGRVDLIWEAPRPDWLPDDFVPHLAQVNWSSELIALDETQYLAGVNFAFPRKRLKEIGGFDPRIDRQGKKLLSNGDILILRQLQNMGYTCYYHPEIAVQHHVSKERLNKKWFLRRLYWQGVSDVVLQQILAPSSRPRLFADGLRESAQLVQILHGGYYSPKRIYWHVMSISFEQWLRYGYRAGRAARNITSTFSF